MDDKLLGRQFVMNPFSSEAYYLIFSALANRSRLAIIDVLKDGPKTVIEISKALEQEEDLIAHNLKPLKKCMLVQVQKSGKEPLYSINKEIVEPLSEMLSFHVNKYCPGLEKCISHQKLKEYMKHEAAKTTYIEHE
jgi:DNA-binding transcriptional ArsR family regulator